MGFDDAVNFAAQGVPVGQVELVSAYEKLVVDAFECVLHSEAVFLCAQNDAEGVVVSLGTDLVLEVVEIEVHLADILMLNALFFEVHKAICLKNYIVEHQVNVEVPSSKRDVLLPAHKCKAFAQFQHEHTEITGKGVLQCILVPGGEFRQAGEFKDEWISYDVFGFLDLDALVR